MPDEQFDLSRIKAIASNPPELDPGILEMLPYEARELLTAGPQAILVLDATVHTLKADLAAKDQHIADINAALQMYAQNTGQGQIMFNDIRLCLDQVKMLRQQGAKV